METDNHPRSNSWHLPVIDRTLCASASGLAKGAYILKDSSNPVAILIATGSELSLALDVHDALAAQAINVRVVSAPCLEWFAEQDESYKSSVLPASIPLKVSIEVGIAQGWREIIGDAGLCISLEHYGASADAKMQSLRASGLNSHEHSRCAQKWNLNLA